MKIAYNPLGSAAYIPAADNKDLIFDLVTRTIYAKGIPFDGTKYNTFKKHTSPDNTGGSEGLVPIPSYSALNNRLLREDGLWVLIAGVSAPDDALSLESTNSVENKVITKKFNEIIALLLLKAEHVYKNIVINGVLLLAQGANDTLTIIQGDGITLTPNSDNKSITISTKALGLLGIDISYSGGQLIAKVADTYYARWNEVFNWYQSVTEEDTDTYINKWQEIVDFLNNVLSGTNILDEFVTRKTAQIITGYKVFSLDSETAFVVDNQGLTNDKDYSSIFFGYKNEYTVGIGGASDKYLYRIDLNGNKFRILDEGNYKNIINTNLYWANVPILSASDSNTNPTFGDIITANILPKADETYSIGSKGNEYANGDIRIIYARHIDSARSYTSDTDLYIQYLQKGNTLMQVNGGNVGIGTGSPSAKLHVAGESKFTDTMHVYADSTANYTEGIRLYGAAKDSTFSIIAFGCDPSATTGTHANQWLIGRDNSNRFEIRNNTTSLLYVLNNGNVGIGTPSPSYKLTVVSSSTTGFQIKDVNRPEASMIFTGNDGNSWVVGKGVGGSSYNNTFGWFTNKTLVWINSDGTINTLGDIYIEANKGLIQKQADTSNYTSAIKWYKGGVSQGDYNPQIGQHNTGGDGTGSICILPYTTSTSPWYGSVGLWLSKTQLLFEGNTVLHSGNYSSILDNRYYTETEADNRFVNVTGDIMTGSLTFSTDSSITWSRNTDYASIRFQNTSDGDTNSYLDLQTGDNGNEYIRFSRNSGGTVSTIATIKAEGIRTYGYFISELNSRYLRIGPQNSSHAYYETNADISHWFNKRVDVNGAIWRYNTNYGIDSDGSFHAKVVYANKDGSSTGGGISLYSTSDPMTYGIAFRGTGTYGTHGGVSGDWATYFTMSDTTTRGWIFRRGSSNVFSISGTGYISSNNSGYFAGNLSSANSGASNPGDAALEVREYARAGTNTSTAPHSLMYAPRIGFHWGNRYWGNIIYYDNTFRFMNNNASAYVPIQASTITGGTGNFTNLTVINDSSNSGYDALAYFRHYSNNDWAVIIDKTNSYSYGLDIRCGGDLALKVGAGKTRLIGATTIGADASASYTLDVRGNARATGRIYANEWIQFDNATGLYWPNIYGAHFYPNATSYYGQFQLLGTKNGYSGIHFGNTINYLTVMSTDTHHGLYCENYGWEFYFNRSNSYVGIRSSSTPYPVSMSGDSYTTGWSRAASGFYVEDTGVHFTHQGTLGEIDMTSNNEFLWGSNSSTLYFNYRAVSRGTTVTNYIWNAGSSTSYAAHSLGALTSRGDLSLYGLTQTCNKANNANYMNSALQIREYNFGGAQSDTWAIAPRLSWHWSGRVLTLIGLSSGGDLYLSKNQFANAYLLLHLGNSSVSGGGSSGGSSITVNIGNNSKTLTIPTSLPANGGTSSYTNYLKIHDVRGTNHGPNAATYPINAITAWFNSTGTPDSSWYSGLTFRGWTDGYAAWQICSYSSTGTSNNYNLYLRNGNNSTWGSWKTILDSSNYSGILDSRYVNTSGDTMTGPLTFANGTWNVVGDDAAIGDYNAAGMLGLKSINNNIPGIGFHNSSNTLLGRLQANGSNLLWNDNKIWHEGNDGSGSGLNADLLDGYHVTHFMSYIKGSGYVQANLLNSELWNVAGGNGYIEYYDNGTWFNSRWGLVLAISGFHRVGSSDSYVLLGGGGHKAVSDFAPASHSHSYVSTGGMVNGAYAVIPTYNGETGWHRIATIDGGTGYGSWILYLCGNWSWASNTSAILHINTMHTTARITQVSGIVGFVTDVRLVPISSNNYYVDVYINYSGAHTPGTVYCYFLGNGTITTRTTAEKITASVSTSASITLVTGTRTNDSSYAAHFYENSDVKLKTNIQNINSSDNIPLLKEFDWKSDGSHGYGLIAQELEAMGYPELVSGELDGTKTVNYSAALSLIVGKLQVKIRELEKEIENLKNKN